MAMTVDAEDYSLPRQAPADSIILSFEPRNDRLIGLGIVNGVLLVMTLGLYSAWAKTEVRRRLWSFTRINGEPLEYTGTGRELFVGLLVVFALVVLPVLVMGAVIGLVFPNSPSAQTVYQIFIYGLFFLLFGIAAFRAQRYRLSRSQWRGIRGSLVDRALYYGWTHFWTLVGPILVIATAALGAAYVSGPAVGGAILLAGMIAAMWILPWRSNILQQIITTATRFGDQPLRYTGRSGPLYARYLYAWAASAVVILAAIAITAHWVIQSGGIDAWRDTKRLPPFSELFQYVLVWLAAIALFATLTAWYRASQIRHFAANTHFGDATFRSTVTGGGLALLTFTNWVLRIGALLTAIATGAALIYATGAMPSPESTEGARFGIATLDVILVGVPIVVLNSVATTFAQFRTTRYTISRLSLDGPVDIAAVFQNQESAPGRGEGLAQVFDIDGF